MHQRSRWLMWIESKKVLQRECPGGEMGYHGILLQDERSCYQLDVHATCCIGIYGSNAIDDMTE